MFSGVKSDDVFLMLSRPQFLHDTLDSDVPKRHGPAIGNPKTRRFLHREYHECFLRHTIPRIFALSYLKACMEFATTRHPDAEDQSTYIIQDPLLAGFEAEVFLPNYHARESTERSYTPPYGINSEQGTGNRSLL